MSTVVDRKRFDLPLYTVADAARIVDVAPSTLTTWAKGYVRRVPGRPDVVGAPVISYIPSGQSKEPTIPFVGLAEATVLAAVRRSGVPMQRIRPALDEVQASIGLEHALASQRLHTDGAELMFDYAESRPDGDERRMLRELVVVRSGQRVFAETVEGYLRRIEYGSDGYASLIHVPAYEHAQVVADPMRSFGTPIFERGGCADRRRPPTLLDGGVSRRAVIRVRRPSRPARGRRACRIPTSCLTSSWIAASGASRFPGSYESGAFGS